MKRLGQPCLIQLIHVFAPNSAIVTYRFVGGIQLVFRVLQLLAIRLTQRNLCRISKKNWIEKQTFPCLIMVIGSARLLIF